MCIKTRHFFLLPAVIIISIKSYYNYINLDNGNKLRELNLTDTLEISSLLQPLRTPSSQEPLCHLVRVVITLMSFNYIHKFFIYKLLIIILQYLEISLGNGNYICMYIIFSHLLTLKTANIKQNVHSLLVNPLYSTYICMYVHIF